MSRTIRSLVACGVAGVGLLGLGLVGGCGAVGPAPHATELVLSDTLQGQTVEVDLVGVNNESDLAEWSSYNVNDYFKAGDKRRGDDTPKKKTFRFAQGSSNTVKLDAGDEIWKSWNKPTHLIVLANIPGNSDQGGKSTDSRRKVLPLAGDFWEGRELKISVQPSGLKVLTAEKPKKK